MPTQSNKDSKMRFPINEYGNRWIYGDLFSHERHIAFLRSKSQAVYRHKIGLETSGWELTMEEFFEFWDTEEKWNNRGRLGHSFVLTRRDLTKPWCKDNCYVTTRLETLIRTNGKQLGKKRRVYTSRQKK
jgi:hypothetical protein